jgi:hypothetical protein
MMLGWTLVLIVGIVVGLLGHYVSPEWWASILIENETRWVAILGAFVAAIGLLGMIGESDDGYY